MKTRAVLALSAILAGGVSAGAANAAIKKPKPVPPVCNLVTDGAGDGEIRALTTGPAVPVADDNTDILSADIASDAKNITAVIRLKAVGASDQYAPTGTAYLLQFTAVGHDLPIYLLASNPTGGTPVGKFGDVDGTSLTSKGDATVTIANNEVHITAPVAAVTAALGAKLGAGSKLSGLSVRTGGIFGNAPGNGAPIGGGYATLYYDTADGVKSYTAGAKSCVTPGK